MEQIERDGKVVALRGWTPLHYVLDIARSKAVEKFGRPDQMIVENGAAI